MDKLDVLYRIIEVMIKEIWNDEEFDLGRRQALENVLAEIKYLKGV